MAATASSYSITMRLHTAPDHGVVGAFDAGRGVGVRAGARDPIGRAEEQALGDAGVVGGALERRRESERLDRLGPIVEVGVAVVPDRELRDGSRLS